MNPDLQKVFFGQGVEAGQQDQHFDVGGDLAQVDAVQTLTGIVDQFAIGALISNSKPGWPDGCRVQGPASPKNLISA